MRIRYFEEIPAAVRLAVCAALMAVSVFILMRVLPSAPLLVNRPGFSQAVYDGKGRLLRLTLSGDEKFRLWVPYEEFNPKLVEATLLYEDRFFHLHPGVNPFSLLRAFAATYLAGSRRTGGSTITMQVARMRFGIRSRSLRGKVEQILRALELELFFSKRDILEAYLNTAPYGENIEGAGTAGIVYFGKMPEMLTGLEALTLAVIPQNPARRAPRHEGVELIRARNRLAEKWQRIHGSEAGSEGETSLPFSAHRRSDLPFEAPHFVNRILGSDMDSPRITTTLDLDLQHLLEDKVRSYVEQNRKFGIRNADALLIRSDTMEVKALVGSADFFDRSIQGQVDGTRARRSPGSALKPFLDGRAIDEGIIHPKSLLKDSPASYASWNPENFDREFLGPVKATDALIKSRNLPAIQLANALQGDGFYRFLRRARIGGMRESDFYGLSLVLGGVEVTMEEMVELYAMLANAGKLQRVKFREGGIQSGEEQLLSREAAFLVLEMLKSAPRPTADFGGIPEGRRLEAAWKTGTSFGFRDAWTAGVLGPYVLAVWVGNFNGEGNPVLVGRETAARLFFDIVDVLSAQPGKLNVSEPGPGLNVRKVRVCSTSGQLPGAHCPHTEESWFIPGKSPIQGCRVHREIFIDESTGLRECDIGVPRAGVRRAVFEFWPSDLLRLFQSAGLPRRMPPRFIPNCSESTVRGLSPDIVSPQKGVSYALRVDQAVEDVIPFRAVADADVHALFWFVDGGLVGQTLPHESFFWKAGPGKYVIRVLDDYGRGDSREIDVRMTD